MLCLGPRADSGSGGGLIPDAALRPVTLPVSQPSLNERPWGGGEGRGKEDVKHLSDEVMWRSGEGCEEESRQRGRRKSDQEEFFWMRPYLLRTRARGRTHTRILLLEFEAHCLANSEGRFN